MKVHMKPLGYIVRVYDDDKFYEKRDPYKGIAYVSVLTDKTCYVQGFLGKDLGKTVIKDLILLLKAEGFETILIERRGEVRELKN